MPLKQRGFTLAEMLIVVVIFGLLSLVSLPKFQRLRERNQLNSARQEIAAAFATARAAAIQKGSRASVVLKNGSLTVSVVGAAGGATTTLIGPKPLNTLYGVTVTTNTSADTAATYNMRGFAWLGSKRIVRIAGSTRSDSLCLTSTGQILPRSCSL